ERRRILERVRGVCIEETTAVGPKHLDRLLRCRRALCDRLLRPFDRGRNRVRMQILDHALRTENQCRDDRNRQQNIQSRSRHIDPEVADSLDRLAREPAHERDGNGEPAGRGCEVMNRQPGHLYEVTERCFRHVALPVRVGSEADSRVETEIRTYIAGSVTLWVKRKPDLQSLDCIQQNGTERAEREQSAGIPRPVLLLRFALVVPADSAETVNQTFDRSENRSQKVLPALDDGRDKGSEWLRTRQNQQEENCDL